MPEATNKTKRVFRVTAGKFRHDGLLYKPGDEVVLSQVPANLADCFTEIATEETLPPSLRDESDAVVENLSQEPELTLVQEEPLQPAPAVVGEPAVKGALEAPAKTVKK